MRVHHYLMMLLPAVLGAAIGVGVFAWMQENRKASWGWGDSLPFMVPGVFIGAIIGGSMVLGSLQKAKESKKSSDEVLQDELAKAHPQITVPVPAPVAEVKPAVPTVKPVAAAAPEAPKHGAAAHGGKPAGDLSELMKHIAPESSVAAMAAKPERLSSQETLSDDAVSDELEAELKAALKADDDRQTQAAAPKDGGSEDDELADELRAALKAADDLEKGKRS